MKLGFAASLTLACRIGSVACAALFRLFLAVYLGPDDQARYYSFLNLSFLIAAVGSLGLGPAASYFLANRPEASAGIRTGTLHLTLLVATVTAAGAIPLVKALQPQGSVISAEFFFFLCCSAVFWACSSNSQGVLLGMQRPGWAVVPMALANIVNIFAFVVFAGSGHMPPLYAAAAAWCTAAAATAIVYYCATAILGKEGIVGFGNLLGKRLCFGIHNATAAFLSLAFLRVDFFVLSNSRNFAASGAYSFAEMVSEALWFAPDAIAFVFLPHASGSSDEQLRKQGPRVIRMTWLFSCVAALALALCGWVIIRHFFSSYGASLPLIFVLLPGYCAIAVAKICFSILASRAHQAEANAILLAAVIATWLLSYALLPLAGSVGVACAASIVSILYGVAMLWRVSCRFGQPWKTLLVPRREDTDFLRAFMH